MERPSVSVIMPVRNEAAWIQQSLSAVLAQDYPANLIQILLVDGQSEDRTRELAAGVPGAERITILSNPARRQAVGLNLGLRHSHGEVIVRIDGHTLVAPNYVSECVGALAQTGAHGVGGMMRPVGLTPTGRAIASATMSRFAVPTAFHVSQTARYTDTVYMGAWPRAVLDRVGGFDEDLPTNEDYELHYRIRQAGGKLYLTPAIASQYICRQSLGGVMRQYYAYGQGKIRTLARHPRSVRLRHLVAPGLLLWLILGLVLGAFVGGIFLVGWLASIACYILLCLLATLQIGRNLDHLQPRLLWTLPFVFGTIHLSWGAGFWRGLLHWPHGHVSNETWGIAGPLTTPQVEEAHISTLESVSVRTTR
jgi:glycosyltransferase involved in cell wall biosynthesis